jgi:TetR/AcrR family transcriptional regulator
MKPMPRARSDEAKAQRFAEILAATADLFDEVGPDLSLQQVAARCGLARTSLYGYAQTKEELLLLLTAAELRSFFAHLDNALGVGERPAVAVATAVAALPRLAPLLTVSPTVIESNVSFEAALAWKQQIHTSLLQTGGALDRLADAPKGSGARFLLHAYAVVTGLYLISNPAPIAAKAIDTGGFSELRIEFRGELLIALSALEHQLLPHPKVSAPSRRNPGKVRSQ